jgi:hypothetical protein
VWGRGLTYSTTFNSNIDSIQSLFLGAPTRLGSPGEERRLGKGEIFLDRIIQLRPETDINSFSSGMLEANHQNGSRSAKYRKWRS